MISYKSLVSPEGMPRNSRHSPSDESIGSAATDEAILDEHTDSNSYVYNYNVYKSIRQAVYFSVCDFSLCGFWFLIIFPNRYKNKWTQKLTNLSSLIPCWMKIGGGSLGCDSLTLEMSPFNMRKLILKLNFST